MYWAKQRALVPSVTGWLAIEHVGSVTFVTPAAFASLAIPAGVMSGVPTIASCLRLSLTVERPSMPATIAPMPSAIRTMLAATPP